MTSTAASLPQRTAASPLPRLVGRHLEQAVPGGLHSCAPPPMAIRLHQRGLLWRLPGAEAVTFTATQEIAVQEVGFDWKARLGAGRLHIPHASLQDGFDHGEGYRSTRVLGLGPAHRRAGSDLGVLQALRYLAELPLAPQALRANHALQWRALDPRHVEVATATGDGRRAALELSFDARGLIDGATCTLRPRLLDDRCVTTPWGCAFGGYAVLGGMRLPTRAMAWWELPGGPFTYWKMELVAAEALG